MSLPIALLIVALLTACTSAPVPVGSLTGDGAVEFLRTAKIDGRLEKEFDSLAITDPIRVTLTDGATTARAVFKDVDTVYMKFRFGDGRTLTNVRDSYKHEIAAYQLDVMLGLNIVAPCVERTIHGRTGSLCLWIENTMTESDRIKREIQPPDAVEFNNRMHVIRVFLQLIWDQDYNNVRNLLVDENFKLYKIDSSMAFRADPNLRKEASLSRFSREVLHALGTLDSASMNDALGPWLSDKQIETLWHRRGRLLQLAQERIAMYGEAATLY